MNGEDGASHTDILRRVGQLEGARVERDKAVDDRLDRMEGKIDKLVAVTDMGKGAWWMVVKLGAIIDMGKGAWWMVVKLGAIAAGLAAAGTWIWDRLPDGLKKSLIG